MPIRPVFKAMNKLIVKEKFDLVEIKGIGSGIFDLYPITVKVGPL